MKPAFKGRVLFVVALLFLISASIRLGAISVPAVAKEAQAAFDDTLPASEEPSNHQQTGSGTSSLDGHDASPDGLRLVLKALQDKERALNAREHAIAEREIALEKADRMLSKKLVELEQAEVRLRATLGLAEGAVDEDIGRLVTVYEKMPPKDSAVLFQQMEPNFAAGFLARMRPEIAAGILAGMDPKAAYAISAVMAGRNTKVPRR